MPIYAFKKKASVETLKGSIEKNLDRYRNGDFKDLLEKEPTFMIDANIDQNILLKLNKIKSQDNKALSDIENSIFIYEHMKSINPRLSREPRLWTYLTHSVGLDYARSRWPLGSSDELDIKQINDHFFADNTPRALERNNALAQLWMSAHVANKVKVMSLRDCLEIILMSRDFRMQIIERPRIFRSTKVLSAVVKVSKVICNKDPSFLKKAQNYRNFFKNINLEGGHILLDGLSEKDLNELVKRCSNFSF